MTVAEMIDWLKTMDQESVVHVIKHSQGTGYDDQGGTIGIVPFSPEAETFKVTDFRALSWVGPEDPDYNKRYLLLGSTDN